MNVLLLVLSLLTLSLVVGFALVARKWKTFIVSELAQLRSDVRSHIPSEVARARSDIVSFKLETIEEITNAVCLYPLRLEFPVFLNGPSIDACHARTLLFVLQELKPNAILELGSGTSTILISRALQLMNASPQLHIAVDHEERFLRNTQELARINKLDHLIRFECCPLAPLDGFDLPWYSRIPELSRERRFDLVIVDGPPAYEAGKSRSREPALPQLRSYLNEGAVVILDDANRPGEREMVSSWRKTFPEFSVSTSSASKGIAIFTLRHS